MTNTNNHNICTNDFNNNLIQPPTILDKLLNRLNYKLFVNKITTDYRTTFDMSHRAILILD